MLGKPLRLAGKLFVYLRSMEGWGSNSLRSLILRFYVNGVGECWRIKGAYGSECWHPIMG
jgi:hypothetical protein